MDFLEKDFGIEIGGILGGSREPSEPGLCNFINTLHSAILFRKHICGTGNIIIHSDVDVDGVGSGYILNRFLSNVGVNHRVGNIINSTKVHGIMHKHIDWFNSHGGGLLVILDSSSNSLDIIKRAKGDVIVIDHHEVSHNELTGDTDGGRYVIVNNTISNKDITIQLYLTDKIDTYDSNVDMSCGLVVYEWLRVFERLVGLPDIVERLKLYQWAALTLFTDVISTSNLRNLYYIDKTVHAGMGEYEGTLNILLDKLSYTKVLDKSFINFTLAPRVNKAIRAGASKVVLHTILKEPEKVVELDVYSPIQEDIIKRVIDVDSNTGEIRTNGIVANGDTYIIADITDIGISKDYTGVIASKLMNEYDKDVVVCVRGHGNEFSGSVRGLSKGVDYRGIFSNEFSLYAEGHSNSFGVTGTIDKIEDALKYIGNIRKNGDTKLNRRIMLVEPLRLEYSDDIPRISMERFIREQGLLKMALANSYLISDESYELWVENFGAFTYRQKGKLYIYNINGLECKSFELLNSRYISIYVEYSNQINIFARNVNTTGNLLDKGKGGK